MKQGSYLAVFTLLSCALHASNNTLSQQRFYLNTSFGYLSGTAHERVYDPVIAAQLSHLVWKIEAAPIVRAEGAYKLNSWLEASLNGWINLGEGNALMDDYDWFPPIVPFAMWSHHPDTDLQQAHEVDVNLKAWLFQSEQYQLGGILGYQRNLYSFVAKGGCYNYFFGIEQGCFPEGQVQIGYQQTYNMPYIGVAARYLFKAWELSGLFKYSDLVTARDTDQHYQRYLSFYDGAANRFKFYALNANLGYYVKPQIKLFAEGLFNSIPNQKTGTVIIDQLSNERIDVNGDAAGLSNKNYVLSFGVQYTGLDG